mmetsp:Transcript_91046/g.283670  ORF Transcript_91046/g.283670 Transcript_91046/m.283670 type:complete len:239 (+) Transcript_91046:188-904(+)
MVQYCRWWWPPSPERGCCPAGAPRQVLCPEIIVVKSKATQPGASLHAASQALLELSELSKTQGPPPCVCPTSQKVVGPGCVGEGMVQYFRWWRPPSPERGCCPAGAPRQVLCPEIIVVKSKATQPGARLHVASQALLELSELWKTQGPPPCVCPTSQKVVGPGVGEGVGDGVGGSQAQREQVVGWTFDASPPYSAVRKVESHGWLAAAAVKSHCSAAGTDGKCIASFAVSTPASSCSH